MSVDLYLGSDLGLWVLQQANERDIQRVITADENIASCAKSKSIPVIFGNANAVEFENAEAGLSVHYPRLLKSGLISKYKHLYNLHPGYLPYGRGYYPIFWALWENTPAGATLHEIVEAVDEGPIIEQRQVEYFGYDTGETLFRRVRAIEQSIFMDFWPLIVQHRSLPGRPQPTGGTYHTKKDFYQIKKGTNWKSYTGEELIRLVRALSFSGFTGLEINIDKYIFDISMRVLEDE